MTRELSLVRRPVTSGARLDNDNCAIDDPLFAWDNARHIHLTLWLSGDGPRPARRTADDKRKSIRLVPPTKSQVPVAAHLHSHTRGMPAKSVVGGDGNRAARQF